MHTHTHKTLAQVTFRGHRVHRGNATLSWRGGNQVKGELIARFGRPARANALACTIISKLGPPSPAVVSYTGHSYSYSYHRGRPLRNLCDRSPGGLDLWLCRGCR